MSAKIQYVDPVDGVDGTGTVGVDWFGNTGLNPYFPRKTADVTGLVAGAGIMFKEGTTYPLTGVYQRVNGSLVTSPANAGLALTGGSASTLLKDRIIIGSYADNSGVRQRRPILDGLGIRAVGLSSSGFNGNATVHDLEIANCLAHACSINAPNMWFDSLYIHDILNAANDSDGIYISVSMTGWKVTRCISDRMGADHYLLDTENAANGLFEGNFMLRIGMSSFDGADGFVVARLPTGLTIRNNVYWKVSRQKQMGFLSLGYPSPPAAPAAPPLLEQNHMVGVTDGGGAITLIGVPAMTFRRNILISNRGLINDRHSEFDRYAEGVTAYANVLYGIPAIPRPDGTGAADIDAEGYADGSCFGGSKNASAHVVSKYTNNLIYNFRRAMSSGFDSTANKLENTACVRMKEGALTGQVDNAAATGCVLFDDGNTLPRFAGTPVGNTFVDGASATPISLSSPDGTTPVRLAGNFPVLTQNWGVKRGTPGWQVGDGAVVSGITDINGATFAVESGRCNTGVEEVAA